MKRIVDAIKKAYKWIATDGLLHIFASLAITLAVYTLLHIGTAERIGLSAFIAFCVGVIKEGVDSARPKGTGFSVHDIICDITGIAIGVTIVSISLIY